MKKVMVIVLLSFFVQLFSATYSVDGYAYLEGQTDHSGIEVFFQRVAPDTLFSYTVFTETSGYYSQSVENGIYNIIYSKTNYLDSLSTGRSLYSNTTLGDVTLKKKSNIIGAGTHVYSADLVVASGDTLIIEPGARMEFMEGKRFIVNGLLLAQGTESQMIYITAYSTQKRGYLIFNDSSDDNSILSYCVIEKSKENGINIGTASPTVSHCIIRDNYCSYGVYGGGGIFAANSNSRITDCEFRDNYIPVYTVGSLAELRGAGINSYHSSLTIDKCIFDNNENNAQDGWGGAIAFFQSSTILSNSIFINHNTKGAIYSQWDSNITLKNCIFYSNTTPVYIYDSDVCEIENTLFYNNSRSMYILDANIVNVTNSNFSNNSTTGLEIKSYISARVSNSVITNNGEYGIKGDSKLTVEYCDVYGNTLGNYYNCNQYIGTPVTTNSNGDPCDAWYNISMDPKFTNASGGDYTLLSDSPCIDAGTNTISGYTFPEYDLAGNQRIQDGNGYTISIVDMGAYEYEYAGVQPGGSGISSDPYVITDRDNLIWIGKNLGAWDKYCIQAADIDISSINKGMGWSPIGNSTVKFTGNYDGQGYTLAGLYINRPGESGIGLFGRTLNAEIKNLNLTNVNITGSASTGGLAGYIETTVVSECSVTGSVTGANNTGGLIGSSLISSQIRSCSSISAVNSTKYSGGLCGYNTTNSVISNSFSLGDVNGSDFAGGFLGYNNNSAIVNNCYSAGSVSGEGTKGGFVAGNVNESEVNGSFWDLNTSGQSESAGGTGKTTEEMQTMTTYTEAGWDFVGESVNGNEDIWVINELNNYGYPYIASLPVGIENNEAEIYAFELYQNYPNPFNPVTAISYALPKAAQVELNVYNLQGQLVQSLVNAKQPKGTHKAEFNGAGLTSGMYVYRLKVDGKSVQSRKMMMLK
jgi:hypothetical protein